MDIQKKAQWLVDFYQKLVDNNNGFTYTNSHIDTDSGPHLDTRDECLKFFKVNLPKPKKKNIDLSVMVGSGNIDMEFCYGKDWSKWNVSKLLRISSGLYWPSIKTNQLPTKICRIRENHWHPWQGGECPLPEGLIIKVTTDRNINKSFNCIDYFSTIYKACWNRKSNAGWIISFKVIGIKEGWKYEWEEE